VFTASAICGERNEHISAEYWFMNFKQYKLQAAMENGNRRSKQKLFIAMKICEY
jgi:hypothetical protein